jgi:hypothetical protein
MAINMFRMPHKMLKGYLVLTLSLIIYIIILSVGVGVFQSLKKIISVNPPALSPLLFLVIDFRTIDQKDINVAVFWSTVTGSASIFREAVMTFEKIAVIANE